MTLYSTDHHGADPNFPHKTDQNLAAERIESLKAGVIGAISLGIVLVGVTWLYQFGLTQALAVPGWADSGWVDLINRFGRGDDALNGVRLAFAGLTGFLFGATYRYIVRQDANPHLRGGAVMAFGLIRGLAQVDVERSHTTALAVMGSYLVINLLLFGITALVLDRAMQQGWVKPFSTF